jgi:hypothetical protein
MTFRGSYLAAAACIAVLVLAQATWAEPANARSPKDTDTRDASYKLATSLAKRKKYQEAADYFFMALSGTGIFCYLFLFRSEMMLKRRNDIFKRRCLPEFHHDVS